METKLSPTEKRLCRLRDQGLQIKEIADLLNRDYGYIRNCFSKIYTKIGRRECDMSLIRNASGINDLQLDTRRDL